EPNFLGSAAEVAEACDVVQLFVPDASALFEVIENMLPRLGERHTILCNATVGPVATRDAGRRVMATGAQFLDAPFTGSKNAAAKGDLVYYIGGDDDALARVEPILKASSKAILKIGEIGDAAAIKIATNMLAAVEVQALAEALALSKRSGIAPETFVKAMELHGTRSGLIDMKLPGMINGDYEPHFTMQHMFKDVRLGIKMANALDLDIPTTSATAGVIYGAIDRGWTDLDYSALMKMYETVAPPNEAAVEEAKEEKEEPERVVENESAEEEQTAEEPLPEAESDNSEEVPAEQTKRGGLFGWLSSRERR
ncbi:MAG: NAD(P)-dependent oxidoreductase, partial [Verrucomicrobiota bacterium]|nr:NAD(P)-dependent oxidoreductase [Verrucomicrobiota bacterium]